VSGLPVEETPLPRSRLLVFADESGNFDFSPKGTRFFVLATVTTDGAGLERELLDLRRELAWDGHDFVGGFHASEESNAVRSRVFEVLVKHDFRVDATILEKRKAAPRIRDHAYFYKLAWYAHMKHLAPVLGGSERELHVVAATLGSRGGRTKLREAVASVVAQTANGGEHRVSAWSCDSDPMLQVADYCCWAVYRKWEREDNSWYGAIASKLGSEYDWFRGGRTLYY